MAHGSIPVLARPRPPRIGTDAAKRNLAEHEADADIDDAQPAALIHVAAEVEHATRRPGPTRAPAR